MTFPNGHAKKLGRFVLRPLLANRYTRMMCTAYLYRRWIAHSEAVVALHRRDSALDEHYWMGKLRQYAHILDKGLHRADFTTGHGVQTYERAAAAAAHLKSPEALSDPSVTWALDRIRLYERRQSGAPSRLTAECPRTTCAYEDLLDAIRTRRSVRCYEHRPVADDVIEKITDALDWSPTSCNRQPARAYATNNPEIVRRCVQLHGGAACFTDIHAPLFLTFCADCRVYDMPAEVAMPYIDVALGVQNCALVAHTLGVSLTLLTWALHSDTQDRELRRILNIPDYCQIVVGAVGGYPNGGAQVPARKHKELTIVK